MRHHPAGDVVTVLDEEEGQDHDQYSGGEGLRGHAYSVYGHRGESRPARSPSETYGGEEAAAQVGHLTSVEVKGTVDKPVL